MFIFVVSADDLRLLINMHFILLSIGFNVAFPGIRIIVASQQTSWLYF